ncbi:MAG: serine acetyltransferase [Myxococcales bacterium]|nr:serine acetyltransferase [Myxococcales bacterium]
MMDLILAVFFPGYFGRSDLSGETMPFYLGSKLDKLMKLSREQIKRGLYFVCENHNHEILCACEDKAEILTRRFARSLPDIRRLLCTDVHAAYIGDPAALSTDEVIFCYPGLFAIAHQRIAHRFYQMGVPILPRLMTERAHSLTGIDIHPGASIAEGLFIDHGTGVVIGETAVIGRRVRLYQGVTLGAKSFPLDEHGNPIKGIKRHPNLEDEVIVYSGATILGDVTIGEGSVIGGNVWLTHSVPPHSRITQSSHRSELFEAGSGI